MTAHLTRYALTSLSLVALLPGAPATANPQGASVQRGGVTVEDHGSTLILHQSTDRAVVNWRDFSIGAGETTRFIQPSSSSIILNRVTGGNPSTILGRMQANGRVMLLNPNGILFGRNAQVDVSGLVASTADLSDDDFMAGRMRFARPGEGMVINAGRINIHDHGFAALMAKSVENTGTIEARLGRISLAAGDAFTLDLTGDNLVAIQLPVATTPRRADGSPVPALVANSGSLIAEGGRVQLSARALEGVIRNSVNSDGVVRVSSVRREGGRIILGGGDHGTVTVNGRLEATSSAPAARGGWIGISGEMVDIQENARIDASGPGGGGTVLIGGDYQGGAIIDANLTYAPARHTRVAHGAEIKADALEQGDGGKVIVWADGATGFGGAISARGGAAGGDGGFAEVSGKQHLQYRGLADLRAPLGTDGELLLDPTDITICNGCATGALTLGATIGDDGGNAATSMLDVADIEAQLLLGNVTITTSSGGAGTGDINFAETESLTYMGAAERTLTFISDNHSYINGNIDSTNAPLNLSVSSHMNASVAASDVSAIYLHGGDLTVSAGHVATIGDGSALHNVYTEGGDVIINAGNGAFDMTGQIAIKLQGIDAGGGNISATSHRDGNIHAQYGKVVTDGTGHIDIQSEGDFKTGAVSASLGLRTLGTGGITVVADTDNDQASVIEVHRGFHAEGGGNINLTADTITVKKDISSAGGDITINGDIVVMDSGLAPHSIDATYGGSAPAGGNITIHGGIDLADTQTTFELQGGTDGAVTVTGAIDTTLNPGNSLVADGGTIALQGPVTAETLDLRTGTVQASGVDVTNLILTTTASADVRGMVNGLSAVEAATTANTLMPDADTHRVNDCTKSGHCLAADVQDVEIPEDLFDKLPPVVPPVGGSPRIPPQSGAANPPPSDPPSQPPGLGDIATASGDLLNNSEAWDRINLANDLATLEAEELLALGVTSRRGGLVAEILALLDRADPEGSHAIPSDAFGGEAAVLIPGVLRFDPVPLSEAEARAGTEEDAPVSYRPPQVGEIGEW